MSKPVAAGRTEPDPPDFERLSPREHAELATLHAHRAGSASDGGDGDRALVATHVAAAIAGMAKDEGNDLICRAQVHSALAMLYGGLDDGDASENAELALVNAQSALALWTRAADTARAAGARANLGAAYLRRRAGSSDVNVEQAIHHFGKALKGLPTGSPGWIDTQSNLAGAYQRRKIGSVAANLARAIQCIRDALEHVDSATNADHWLDLQNNLGNALAIHPRGDDDLREAISHFQAALDATDRELFPKQWADLHSNLSRAIGDLSEGDHAAHLADAIDHLRRTLEVYTAHAFPRSHLETQRALGHKLLQAGRFAEAHDAFAGAIEVERVLFADAFTWDGRHVELASSAALFFRDAYCLVQLGRFDESLSRLEEGRSRVLTEALSTLEARSLPEADTAKIALAQKRVRRVEAEHRALASQAPTRGLSKKDAELREAREALVEAVEAVRPEGAGVPLEAPALLSMIPPTTVVIAPIVTEAGAVILIVPGGTSSLGEEHVLRLDGVTLHDVRELLVGDGGWLAAYVRHDDEPDRWRATIASTCRRLWDALIGPAEAHLRSLNLAAGREVVLLAPGLLALLPLHAATRPVDGTLRCFCDDLVVSYAPNIAALASAVRKTQGMPASAASALVVAVPAEDLPFAALEAEFVLRQFDPGSRRSLAGTAVTLKRTLGEAANCEYVHFACHGWHDPSRPLRSHLKLARGSLTLADVLERLDLARTRLAVLSACETGLFEIEAAVDEQLGLTAGFLQAGSACVVSSLWPVDDVATMLLMQCFYRLHLGADQVSPAMALGSAQRWLKGATNEQLAAVFRDLRDKASEEQRDGVNEQLARFALARDPLDNPFEHPYYWAGFVAHGA